MCAHVYVLRSAQFYHLCLYSHHQAKVVLSRSNTKKVPLSLVDQWLNTMSSGVQSLVRELDHPMPQLKILCVATKIWSNQISNEIFFK